MIHTVIRLSNDAVLVFDAEGEQITEYQGQYGAVRGKIMRDAPCGTQYGHWSDYALEPEMVSGEAW